MLGSCGRGRDSGGVEAPEEGNESISRDIGLREAMGWGCCKVGMGDEAPTEFNVLGLNDRGDAGILFGVEGAAA